MRPFGLTVSPVVMRGLDPRIVGQWREMTGLILGSSPGTAMTGKGYMTGSGQGAFQSVFFPIEAAFVGPYSWVAMRQPPPSHPIPDTADLPEAPVEDALVTRQVRLLGGISMAGTRMTQRMWRQANEAKYLGAEGR